MSASSATYDDFVQVVKNLINAHLIDKIVAQFQELSVSSTDDIITQMAWTPACEDLRKFYVTNVHPRVYLPWNDKNCCTDNTSRLSLNQRFLVLLNRLRRPRPRSKLLNASIQPFTMIPFVEDVSLRITTCSFPSLLKDYHAGLKYNLRMNARRYNGQKDQ